MLNNRGVLDLGTEPKFSAQMNLSILKESINENTYKDCFQILHLKRREVDYDLKLTSEVLKNI